MLKNGQNKSFAHQKTSVSQRKTYKTQSKRGKVTKNYAVVIVFSVILLYFMFLHFYFILWAVVSAAYSALLSSSCFEQINDDDDDDNQCMGERWRKAFESTGR